MEFQPITNPGLFWQAVGVRAVGTAIVTARGAGGPAGFLALSTAHVAADPPTMMVSIGQGTSARVAVLHSRHFAINFLAVGSEALAAEFGGKGARQGADRFVVGEWSTMASGAPTLIGAAGVIDCSLEDTIDRFGSTIAIGRVLGFSNDEGKMPLVSFRGEYLQDL